MKDFKVCLVLPRVYKNLSSLWIMICQRYIAGYGRISTGEGDVKLIVACLFN